MSGFLLCSGVAVPKARTSASAGDTNKLGDTHSDFPPPAFASLPTAPLRKASLRVLPDSGISGFSILWGQPGSTLWSCRGLAARFSPRRKGEEAGAQGGAWWRKEPSFFLSPWSLLLYSEVCLFCRFYFWMVLQSASCHTKTMQLLLSQAVGTQHGK